MTFLDWKWYDNAGFPKINYVCVMCMLSLDFPTYHYASFLSTVGEDNGGHLLQLHGCHQVPHLIQVTWKLEPFVFSHHNFEDLRFCSLVLKVFLSSNFGILVDSSFFQTCKTVYLFIFNELYNYVLSWSH